MKEDAFDEDEIDEELDLEIGDASKAARLGEKDPDKAARGFRYFLHDGKRIDGASLDRDNPWRATMPDGSYWTVLGNPRTKTNDIFYVNPKVASPVTKRVTYGFVGPEGDFMNYSMAERRCERDARTAISRALRMTD